MRRGLLNHWLFEERYLFFAAFKVLNYEHKATLYDSDKNWRFLPMLIELKDVLTLGNAVSGIIGISLAIAGQWYAWLYIIPAVLFDFLDGKIARKTAANEFGKQLDSLADTVSFVVAPSVVLMNFARPDVLVTAASALYVCCGLWRLAKFNLQTDKENYYGLPTPVAAVIVLVLNALLAVLAPFVLLVAGIAMVIPFKLKKL